MISTVAKIVNPCEPNCNKFTPRKSEPELLVLTEEELKLEEEGAKSAIQGNGRPVDVNPNA